MKPVGCSRNINLVKGIILKNIVESDCTAKKVGRSTTDMVDALILLIKIVSNFHENLK